MAILDIRNNQENKITGIKFDGTSDYLIWFNDSLIIQKGVLGKDVALCNWKDFDNFIAACHKARDLWGPK